MFKRGVAHKSMRFSIVEPLGREKLGLTGFANWHGPDERFGLFGRDQNEPVLLLPHYFSGGSA